MRRSFRALLDGAGPVIGTWAQLPHPEAVEIIGAAGFDFAIVDLEHGHFGLERAAEMLRACDAAGLAPLARVRNHDSIGAVLDAGAAAVVVPGITTAEAADAAVAATRFAPHGTRGACPCVRSGGHYIRDWPGYVASTEAGCIVLVETAEGVRNIAAILRTPGVTALMAGPFDLSVSMGHNGNWRHPEVQDAMARLLDAAAAVGTAVIVPVFDPDVAGGRAQMADWQERGVRVFTLGTDKILLSDAARRWTAAVRADG